MLSGKKAQQTALLMQRDFRGMWVKMIDDEGGGGVFFPGSNAIMQYFMCNIW